jgi:MYXO-CTERM domain-containing protein
MMFSRLARTVALTTAVFASAHAQSAVLLQDNFDSDSPSSVLNFNALVNWTVDNGTIDYIRSGGFGIGCVGGSGGCLDMDGSTGNAGRIVSRSTFGFGAGLTYTLSAMISGNQRGGASDTVTFGLLDATTLAVVDSLTTSALAPGAAFAMFSDSYTGLSGSYRLFFEGVGGDNIGAILDNVVFSDSSSGASVSEPGTLALAGLALLAAGGLRRRNKR